jgi:hypothetical protein
MQVSLAYDPSLDQPVPEAVSQSHETGILIRRLRISAQSEFNVAKDVVFQDSRRLGSGARSSSGFDVIASSYCFLNPEKSHKVNCALLYLKSGKRSTHCSGFF